MNGSVEEEIRSGARTGRRGRDPEAQLGTENIREDLNTAVVDAVGRVNDLNQLAANIAVAANLMRDAIQEIENELMEIISRLNQHMR